MKQGITNAAGFKMAASLMKLSAKAAIGVGAVYVTLEQGVWSNSAQGSNALQKVRTKVLPTASEYAAKVPSTEEINYTIADKWNHGVARTFTALSRSPDTMVTYAKDLKDQLTKRP